MSTTTTTTTRDRRDRVKDRYGPMEWAQQSADNALLARKARRILRLQVQHQLACYQFSHKIGNKPIDVTIFQIFENNRRMPCRILEIAKFYWRLWWRVSRRISTPNFVKIGQSVAKLLRFFRFFKMAAVRHLGFVWGTFGPPTVSTWGSAKFGYDRCTSFYNMNISIFGRFGWKMPIHAPKIGVFRQFDPLSSKAHSCVSPCHLSH